MCEKKLGDKVSLHTLVQRNISTSVKKCFLYRFQIWYRYKQYKKNVCIRHDSECELFFTNIVFISLTFWVFDKRKWEKNCIEIIYWKYEN